MVFLLPLLTPSAHAAPGEARADLATVLTDAVVLGGASGHCPVPGAPVDRTYGSDWRPLGFSPAGAFASIALTTTDLGSPTWTVQVVSLVDDTELGVVRHEHRTDGLPTIDAFLAADRPAIDALLAEHGIVPAVQPLAPLPLSLGDATLSVTIEDLSERNSHPHHHFRLTASRSDVGSKQVAEPRGQSLQVLGALQSPYEPRVALVLLNPRPAIEATTDCRCGWSAWWTGGAAESRRTSLDAGGRTMARSCRGPPHRGQVQPACAKTRARSSAQVRHRAGTGAGRAFRRALGTTPGRWT